MVLQNWNRSRHVFVAYLFDLEKEFKEETVSKNLLALSPTVVLEPFSAQERSRSPL